MIFGKRKKLISLAQGILGAMELNAGFLKTQFIRIVEKYGMDFDGDNPAFEAEYQNLIKRFREKVFETVVAKSGMEGQNAVWYKNTLNTIMPEATGMNQVDLDEMKNTTGISPAVLLMTLFYAFHEERITYGEARPINVEEQNIINRILHEIDNEY